VDSGNDKVSGLDQAILDLIAVDQRSSRRFDQTKASSILGGVANFGLAMFEVTFQHLLRFFEGINQFDPTAEVKEHDGVRRFAKGLNEES